MIPTVNGMMTVGVVQLPGVMTGQILAGSSPLVAIRYQMVVVFMLAAATALGSRLFVRLAADRPCAGFACWYRRRAPSDQDSPSWKLRPAQPDEGSGLIQTQ
jgi:Uncharacterised protein family (UPF0014)